MRTYRFTPKRLFVSLYLILALSLLASHGSASEPLSFNRDIRPILADRCFTCHGPDSAAREAGLRFDREDSAKQMLDIGETAIVAGSPETSEMMARLQSLDPDLRMPPPDSNLTISSEEITLLRRWISEGANWERHWSLIAPSKKELPHVVATSWPRNAIDQYVLHQLETNDLSPSPAANREQWLRRVTFDLTGLPPTLADMDAFLADESDDAFERVVDRLLESRAFGERMALEWLDVARYGDTDGLFEDHPRSIYPWRDWVVDAFNTNLPYDEFITWQLAGDLLPNATVDQRVATGFLRNNPTSNEGGIIDEDYRVKYLIDRVNTTSTAMMGLTMECAQCHDHKYDRVTQREYFQFAGFFNSLIGNGNTKGATAPTVRRYTPEQSQRIPAIESDLARIEELLRSTPPELSAEFERWQTELASPIQWLSHSVVESAQIKRVDEWIVPVHDEADSNENNPTHDSALGRYIRLELPKDHVGFLTLSEVQVFSGGRNIAPTGTARQSSVGYSSPAAKAIDGNHNGSFASCSCTNSEKGPWWELDLGAEFPVESVAVWNRTDCCPERLDRLSISILDEARTVTSQRQIAKAKVRDTLPEGALVPDTTLEEFVIDLRPSLSATPKHEVTALQFLSRQPVVFEIASIEVLPEGEQKPVPVKLLNDKQLRIAREPVIVGLEKTTLSAEQTLRVKLRAEDWDGLQIRTTNNPMATLRATLSTDRAKRLEHFRGIWDGFAEARENRKRLQDERKAIDDVAPLTMVASDMPSPRKNFLLVRGEYDRRGAEVSTAPPASIMPFESKLPANRLGLARWLTAPEHPLTARVAVNRYWQMLFGQGIVRTSEDLGTQGDLPTHPELLDYLAVDFIESDWNVKRLLRQIVLSSTYRQSSIRTSENVRMDPQNRLLSRGPRRRLTAESIRDHALSVSGLLKEKLGGPGVHPYQPSELFGANAIGSSGAKFVQSTGDDLYRRSLYTYWKRQIPAANMRILGADGRTTCRTRREQTNTPLQALVLLNDPQFVEAARAFAERAYQQGGGTPSERIGFAFRLATSRQIHPAELNILLSEYHDRHGEFEANVKLAEQYLTGGGAHRPNGEIDKAQLAAYAAVCSLILNLDESITTN